ncbi:16496_t:CDS:2, partial [Funneliformis mosseae]
CWNYEPVKRPNINEVVLSLKKLVSLEIHEVITKISFEDYNKGSTSFVNTESDLKSDESSEKFIDDNDLILLDEFNQFKIIESEFTNNSSLQKQKPSLFKTISNPTFQVENLSRSSLDSLESIYNNTMNNIIDYDQYGTEQISQNAI